MADLNFGLLDTTLPARIAAIPQEAQKQQTANMLQAMQMQGAMRQNEMSQMQLDELKNDRAEMIKLQQDLAAKGGSPDLNQYADMLLKSPKHMQLGIQLKQKLNEQAQFARIMGEPARATAPATAPASAPAAAPMAAPEPGSFGADVAARTAAVPAWAQNNALAPTAAPTAPANALMAGGEAVDALRQKRNALLSLGTPQAIAAAKALDADIALAAKEPVYHNVPGVGLVDSRTGRVVTPSVESTDPLIKQYEYAKKQGFTGTLFDYKRSLAEAGRTPAQPSAPTITQIVDPTDTTKMITIDARRYTGGGAGSPGVIGVSGKEPTAALRENKIESGKSLLADEISNLRAALNTLNAARAIPSTERGALSNISSSLASSGVGQIAGRIVGTEAQTERDVISSSKLRLVNAIKQATGMSAQQLNSNVELQTMLKSLSDPSQSIEANIRNLDNIEKSYVNATSAAMPRAPAAATTTSKAAPAMGAIQDGYRFKGGDPAKASNWEKVGG